MIETERALNADERPSLQGGTKDTGVNHPVIFVNREKLLRDLSLHKAFYFLRNVNYLNRDSNEVTGDSGCVPESPPSKPEPEAETRLKIVHGPERVGVNAVEELRTSVIDHGVTLFQANKGVRRWVVLEHPAQIGEEVRFLVEA